MTINQLIQKLTKIQESTAKTTQVTVDWKSFEHPDWSDNVIEKVQLERIVWAVDDSTQRADGTERTRLVVRLTGQNEDRL